MAGGQLLAVFQVDVDRLVGDLIEEVGSPVPLETGGVERVERGLERGEGHVVQADEQWRADAPHRIQHLVEAVVRPGVAPPQSSLLRIGDRSMTSAPSQVSGPLASCPPPRIAISTACSRANRTQFRTSVTPLHCAIAAWNRSITAL